MILVPAVRSVVQLDGPRSERRLSRLQEIVVAACCQSGRNRLPAITAAASLERGLRDSLARGARGILLDPRAGEALLAVAAATASLALAVGPEGGFDDNEQALAARAGYRAAQLGPRILRTETAGLASVVILQAMAGDLRPAGGCAIDYPTATLPNAMRRLQWICSTHCFPEWRVRRRRRDKVLSVPSLQLLLQMLSSNGQFGGLSGLAQQFQQAGLGTDELVDFDRPEPADLA